MSFKLLHIDAFTNKPFRGNPAAVCLLSQPADSAWMQNFAAEMNLSETAFVVAGSDGKFALRWFTPQVEVDLCGHATLAAAHALWETKIITKDQPAKFQTHSGELICKCNDDWIEMDFPADPPSPTIPPTGLIEAMNVQPVAIAKGRFDYLIEVKSTGHVRSASPDFQALKHIKTRGVILTSRADDSSFDFVSRFFAPAVGINEDPVTGSAHCTLAAYWSPKLNRSAFLAQQLSARTGTVRVTLAGDRALVGGQAVTVFQAEIGRFAAC